MVVAFALAAMMASAVETPAEPAPRKEKLVCKADSRVGTRIAKRTCRTAAEWEQDWKSGSTGARRLFDGIRSQGTNNQ